MKLYKPVNFFYIEPFKLLMHDYCSCVYISSLTQVQYNALERLHVQVPKRQFRQIVQTNLVFASKEDSPAKWSRYLGG